MGGGYELAQQLSIPAYAHENDYFLLEAVEQTAMFLKLPPITPPHIDGKLIDGDEFEIGESIIKVIHTPGHTPGGCIFVVEDTIFAGDTLFKDSIGRTDLPGGNQKQLFDSIKNKIYCLEDRLIVYSGHGQRTSIGYEKKNNPFVRA